MSKKSTKDVVKEAMKDLKGIGFANDDEFDPANAVIFGPKKTQGEIIRDRLIESCRSADGWYIMLDKDVGGNEWQFKDKIVSYDHWTNLTFEISDFVRQKTKIEIERTGMARNYGSGRYRVIFFNVNGNRGEQETLIFPVDAQEYLIDPPKLPGGATSGTDINEILRTVRETQPSTEILSQTLQKGIEIATGKEAAAKSESNTMMTAMMTMMGTVLAAAIGKPVPTPFTPPDTIAQFNTMFGMMKNFGLLDKKDVPQKTLIDFLNEAKLAGIKIGSGNDDMSTMAGKLKDMIGLVRDITGGGGDGIPERPSIWEKIADGVAPKIPDLLIALTKMNGNGNGGNQPRIMPRRSPQAIPQRVAPNPAPPVYAPVAEAETAPLPEMDPFGEPPHVEENPVVEQPTPQPQENTMNQEDAEMVAKFSSELRDAVINDRTDRFPYITQTISQFIQDADLKLKIGQVNAETIIGYIMMLDRQSYADAAMKQKLVSYVNRYIEYVRLQGLYYAICNVCHDFAEFDNKEQFIAETDKTCGQETASGDCPGILQEMY